MTYAILVQQSFNTSQADTELLGYLLSCRARPVEIDHELKVLRREAITQTPRAPRVRRSDPHASVHCIVSTITRQDHSHLAELFQWLSGHFD
jgi:hypothetical protein